ncbi:MAG: aldehyde dehydrogenase family protein [Bdellovibrionota bacterium]
MPNTFRAANFVSGEFIPPREGKYFDHLNPSTGLTSCEVPDSDLLDLVKAIQSANKASATWIKLTANERGEFLNKIADAVERDADLLSRVQARDIGTPVRYAKSISIPATIRRFRDAASTIESETNDRHPLGVVSVVTTWSDCFDTLAQRVAPALALGNVVIAKPSEYSPECAHHFARIMSEAGLPPGVFNLVQGRGAVVGEAIAQHPGLHHIAFCGSTETGQKFMSEAAEPLKRLHLAMGSKNPVLVFPGVDLKATAQIVARITAGCHPAQCLRGSRLFLQDGIFKEFLALLEDEFKSMKQGDPLDPETEIGPLISEHTRQLYRDAVSQALGEKGKSSGSAVITAAEGFFVNPALISDLTYCSTLQQTEVMGPLVTATSFKYQYDAVKYANVNPFGHTGFVFEADAEKARKVGAKLETGQTFLNLRNLPSYTFNTGLKASGLGQSVKVLGSFFSHPINVVDTYEY